MHDPCVFLEMSILTCVEAERGELWTGLDHFNPIECIFKLLDVAEIEEVNANNSSEGDGLVCR